MRQYSPLAAESLQSGVTFHRPDRPPPTRVTPEDPALAVMTDFRQVRALTVFPDVAMDTAYARMQANGVHLLLVVDARNRIVGLITSTDIEGEKPLQVQQARGLKRREILVSDVMTPHERLEVIDMERVRGARVGHVVATLKSVGRQHAMVVDRDAQGNQCVRGLFSASQLGSQLGEQVQTVEIARNFAQIEQALAH
jgi:CBS domain-containing protein